MKKRKPVLILLILFLILTLGVIFSEPLLNGISRNLTYEDPPAKADAIVVLTGSATGNRVRAATRLYHQGMGRKLVFSGFKVYPGIHTDTLMKDYAIQLGVPGNDIITEDNYEEVKIQGETISNLKLLNKNQIRNFILVTSAHQTRRMHEEYLNAISLLKYDMNFLVHPAPDPSVPLQGWWKLRTGRIGIFYEYLYRIGNIFS